MPKQDEDETRKSKETPIFRGILAGLIVANLASAILTTTFGLFHVDTFLSAYKLPLASYATGNIVYAIINTANDVGGAWFVDTLAARSSRSSIVGISGCIFALCFLAPFFRWNSKDSPSELWDAAHFVISLSLYDTCYSFTAILFGSMFTDDHSMDGDTRVGFLAVGRFAGLLTSLLVARAGLTCFRADDLSSFRAYVLFLSVVSSSMFILAHRMMHAQSICGDPLKAHAAAFEKKKPKEKLNFWRAVKDFASHRNFRAWIVMEMLLECQTNFRSSFLKTFVDNLLRNGSALSQGHCDWIVSSLGPLSALASLAMYVPIQKFGYRRIYLSLFCINMTISGLLWLLGSPSAATLVAIFIVVNTVLTSAVQSSGFHLAMGDMVTEMKINQLKENRFDEPSLAGLFMGANALMCKPMDSFLPVIAAWGLSRVGFSSKASHSPMQEGDPNVQWAMFHLLIGPPFVFSLIQLWAFRKYSLGGAKADEIRSELRKLQSQEDVEWNA